MRRVRVIGMGLEGLSGLGFRFLLAACLSLICTAGSLGIGCLGFIRRICALLLYFICINQSCRCRTSWTIRLPFLISLIIGLLSMIRLFWTTNCLIVCFIHFLFDQGNILSIKTRTIRTFYKPFFINSWTFILDYSLLLA